MKHVFMNEKFGSCFKSNHCNCNYNIELHRKNLKNVTLAYFLLSGNEGSMYPAAHRMPSKSGLLVMFFSLYFLFACWTKTEQGSTSKYGKTQTSINSFFANLQS